MYLNIFIIILIEVLYTNALNYVEIIIYLWYSYLKEGVFNCMKKESNKLEHILSILPSIQKLKKRSEAEFYGASRLIVKKLGLPFTPDTRGKSARWLHGWLYQEVYPIEQITGGHDTSIYLVPLAEHEDFLKDKGLNAKAVGMPFIYTEDIVTEKIERVENSLLVMPPHSLSYSNENWDEDSYAKQINDLKDQFDLIVVCLHQICIEKKLWVAAFKKYDIPYIIGAKADDKNSLIRMYKIFNSFEFMTTNQIGSHVAYASYCGCKVSIYGDYAEYSKDDFIDDPYYKRFPSNLESDLLYSSKKYLESSFPFLFSSPIDAKKRISWAEGQLGKENKTTARTLAKLFGWTSDDPIETLKLVYDKDIQPLEQQIEKQQKTISNREEAIRSKEHLIAEQLQTIESLQVKVNQNESKMNEILSTIQKVMMTPAARHPIKKYKLYKSLLKIYRKLS